MLYETSLTDTETIHFKDGRVFERFSCPLIQEGITTGRLWSFRDITEQKRAEVEKEKLHRQLEQAQKMEAIGTLAGGISHDFNNLLQAINGYTQIMLMDRDSDDPDYAKLMTVQKAGDRAAQLVRQLLLFSRKAETERKPVELNREMEQARRILERTLPKMVHIELHLARRLWTISADPVQMEQILLNLGTNAADAMPDGGTLVIETENVTLDEASARALPGVKPGRYVKLTVSDNGQGMDPATRAHIFEPFFTTKEIGKGTGLGLASVYGIVKSHGGSICCCSETGRGTTFQIHLPAIKQADSEAAAAALARPPSGGTETILLADDEESIRSVASQILRKFGYTVLTACSGEEALAIYGGQSGQIDLVIMDIGMPGMGGHRCLQELLQIDPAVKTIIASGYPVNPELKKSLGTGAAGYVGKPYQLTELLEKVRGMLDRKK